MTQRLPGIAISRRSLFWAGGLAGLLLALTTLATLIRSQPNSAIENTVMEWIQGWSAPGLSTLMRDVSIWTDTEIRIALPILAITYLVFSGQAQRGWSVAIALAVIAAAALGFDYGLGQIVERGRPIAESTGSSFPSGHTFGSTVLFGFIAILAIKHNLRMSLRVPLVLLMAALIVLVGISRVFLAAHWPTDVAAGYLLGAILLLLLMPLYKTCVQVICDEDDDKPGGARRARTS